MTFLHIGDHSTLRIDQLPWHLLEADHVVFMAFALIVGVMAYRHGRRVEARVQAQRKDKPHDPR